MLLLVVGRSELLISDFANVDNFKSTFVYQDSLALTELFLGKTEMTSNFSSTQELGELEVSILTYTKEMDGAMCSLDTGTSTGVV